MSKKKLSVIAILVVAVLGVGAISVSAMSTSHHVKTSKKVSTKKESARSSSSVSASQSSTAQSATSAASTSSAKPAGVTTTAPASGTQLVSANPFVYGQPGMCLGYVDSAFAVTSHGGTLSASATTVAGKAEVAGGMHHDTNFPQGKLVPVFWNLTSKDDGVNYGHVAIWDGNGGFYWEGNHSSTPNHLTWDQINDIMNGKTEINGEKVTDSFTGASYIGWSDNLEGVQILAK